MPVTHKVSNLFPQELYKKQHDVENDSLVVCLMETGFVFDPATHSVYADISADEIATGNGYTQATKAISTVAVTEDSNGDALITADPVQWTASGGSIPAQCAAVIINDTHANKTILGCVEYGASYTTADGTIFEISFANGLFKGVPNPAA